MKKSFLFLALSITLFLFIGCDPVTDESVLVLSDHTISVDVISNYTDTLHVGNTNKKIAAFKFFEITGGTVTIKNMSFTVDGIEADKLSNITLYDGGAGTLISNTVTISTPIDALGGTLSFSALNISLLEGSTFTIEVRADIIGGIGQSVNIRITNPNDLTITDEADLSVLAGPGTTDTSFPIGDNVSRHPIK